MKVIETVRGKNIYVDDEDFDMLNAYRWVILNTKSNRHNFYARTTGKGKRINGEKVHIESGMLMHRLILGVTDPKIDVDHINGNGLDNRKCNLRIVTRSQNCINRRAHGSSKYLGVYWAKDRGKWRVEIRSGGRRIHGGQYLSEIFAAGKYDELAEKYHGEYARLNFPKQIKE